MTRHCRHIDIPIAYLHQLTKTNGMLTDFGTKANVPAVLKRFKYWACGHYFLPRPGTAHYEQLDMQFYKMKYIDILAMLKKE
jgi:hypothetical protein